jgi:hypothetical protein
MSKGRGKTDYSVNQRYWGGDGEPRLNPKCVDRELNAKLRPSWPSPMVRATSGARGVPEPPDGKRRLDRENTNLPDRFRK